MADNKKQHKGHFWMMIICCAVMLGGIFLIGRGGSGNWGILFLMLCPLLHVFMMRGHGGHQHGQTETEGEDHNNHQHH